MKLRRKNGAVIFLCCLLGWQALQAESDKQPVRIGAVYNLTGPLSALGLPSMAGARLAVQQLNQRGGVLGRAVELLASDGRTDPATVAAVTLQLVRTPNLSAITGLDDTAMALAAAPIAEKGAYGISHRGRDFAEVAARLPGLLLHGVFR
jgi:branched-chain amino acid transport system substrate-binding protein